MAIARDGRDPSLVLDAGTGIRLVSRQLRRPFSGSIMLSHLHLDHVQGLPFFDGATTRGARTTLLVPSDGDPAGLLERLFSPPFFPVRVAEFAGSWDLANLVPGEREIEGFQVLVREIDHKGGATYGFRVMWGGKSVAYVPDHAPHAANGPSGDETAMSELCAGVDLLIHDSHHVGDDFDGKAFLGHSAVEHSVGLAEKWGARRLLLFHHDPNRTDDEIDEVVSRLPEWVSAAAAGDVLEL